MPDRDARTAPGAMNLPVPSQSNTFAFLQAAKRGDANATRLDETNSV